jgi:outer membrane biosynthesis protein TonB
MMSSAGSCRFGNLQFEAVEMRKLLLLIAIGCLAGSAACASAQAKSPSDRPNLEVPPVPPRVIEAKVVEPPPPEPVEELPPVAQLPPQKRPQPPRDTAKVEPKPAEPAPATEQPAASAPVAPPVPQLRTPSTVDGAEATRQIHDVIERAKKGLSAIDYARLSTERRQQYEQAKLMVVQSEDSLKASNFEFARTMAERADRLARELQGR